MNRLQAALATTLTIATLAPGVAVLAARARLSGFSPSLGGNRVPMPAGLTLEGVPLSVRGARCHFIRFVSRTCQFSLSSRPAFERLEDKALQLGCSSIVVAPEASAFDCDSRPGHRHSHLAFPTVDVATALDLSRTPSIVILDARGGVTWRKVGFANGAELAEAEQALAVAASRGDPLPGQ